MAITAPLTGLHAGEGRHPRRQPLGMPLGYGGECKSWVYYMTNKPNGTLYIGKTDHLRERIFQHRLGKIEGFTKRYKLNRLVYFEGFELYTDAIAAEDKTKNWPRTWKVSRILEVNPEWNDLYEQLA